MQVYDSANKLAKEIRDSKEYKEYKKIKQNIEKNEEKREYIYKAKLELTTGGNYGYTFRVMPKHEMLLEAANLDLIKWITK